MQQVRADYFARRGLIYCTGSKSRLPGGIEPTYTRAQIGFNLSDMRKGDDIFIRCIAGIFPVFIIHEFQKPFHPLGHRLVTPLILVLKLTFRGDDYLTKKGRGIIRNELPLRRFSDGGRKRNFSE